MALQARSLLRRARAGWAAPPLAAGSPRLALPSSPPALPACSFPLSSYSGYDAHYQDPLEKLQYQAVTFHWLAAAARRLAQELCSGRLLLLLEGG